MTEQSLASLWDFSEKTAGSPDPHFEAIMDLLGGKAPRVLSNPNPVPRTEEVRKTPQEYIDHERTNSWDKYHTVAERPESFQWVPTHHMIQFMEYDRRPGGRDFEHNEPRWNALQDHIREHGIKNPLTLEFNPKKGTAHLGEGHHRLETAIDLKHRFVPVRVNRSQRESIGESPVTYTPEPTWGDHVPAQLLPSHLGIPTRPPESTQMWNLSSVTAGPFNRKPKGPRPDDFSFYRHPTEPNPSHWNMPSSNEAVVAHRLHSLETAYAQNKVTPGRYSELMDQIYSQGGENTPVHEEGRTFFRPEKLYTHFGVNNKGFVPREESFTNGRHPGTAMFNTPEEATTHLKRFLGHGADPLKHPLYEVHNPGPMILDKDERSRDQIPSALYRPAGMNTVAPENIRPLAEWERTNQDGPSDDWTFSKVAVMEKYADKLNDFLMNPKSRPDLQTPDAQNFLGTLRNQYHTPQTDPLMPWLTREWKKKRLTYHPTGNLQYQVPGQMEPTPLTPAKLQHWGEWYSTNHATRQGVDLMQNKMHDVHGILDKYNADLAAQRGPEPSGVVHHTLPNNWTIQELQSPEALAEEGDRMGHCTGQANMGYANKVSSGKTKIYSLRDDKNVPHVTMEVTRPSTWGQMSTEDYAKALNHPQTQNLIREQARLRAQQIADFHTEDGNPELIDPNKENQLHHDIHGSLMADYMAGREPDSNRNRWIHNNVMTNHSPNEYIGPEHTGTVQQIQGQGNTIPKPEYQAMIKHWMNTIPEDERPVWKQDDADHIEDYDDLEGRNFAMNGDEDYDNGDGGYVPHGDYGLQGGTPKPTYDWDGVIGSLAHGTQGDAYHVADEIAKAHKENPNSHDARIIHDAIDQEKEFAIDRHNEQFEDAYMGQGWGNEGMPDLDDSKYRIPDPDNPGPGRWIQDEDRWLQDRDDHMTNASHDWYHDGESYAKDNHDLLHEVQQHLRNRHGIYPGSPLYRHELEKRQDDREHVGSWDFTQLPALEPKSPVSSSLDTWHVAAESSSASWDLAPLLA